MNDVVLHDLQIIAFELHDSEKNKQEIYGISIDTVREIRQLESITIIPNSPDFIRGVMNLRGTIIPIIDLKKKLGFSHNHKINPKDHILVAELESKLVGLLIDRVDQIIRISCTDVESHLSAGLESVSYIVGIAKHGRKLIVLLDIEKLMSNSLTMSQFGS